MSKFDWVKDVRVDFAAREVTVVADPARLRVESLIEALADAGFEKSAVRMP
ncbi:MAG: heavy-metal-associated domain-containing protein [Planctomycetes bacterium]|nr:heavy-metal-associated domain-containing protein [Planctomycetota bacterium]